MSAASSLRYGGGYGGEGENDLMREVDAALSRLGNELSAREMHQMQQKIYSQYPSHNASTVVDRESYLDHYEDLLHVGSQQHQGHLQYFDDEEDIESIESDPVMKTMDSLGLMGLSFSKYDAHQQQNNNNNSNVFGGGNRQSAPRNSSMNVSNSSSNNRWQTHEIEDYTEKPEAPRKKILSASYDQYMATHENQRNRQPMLMSRLPIRLPEPVDDEEEDGRNPYYNYGTLHRKKKKQQHGRYMQHSMEQEEEQEDEEEFGYFDAGRYDNHNSERWLAPPTRSSQETAATTISNVTSTASPTSSSYRNNNDDTMMMMMMQEHMELPEQSPPSVRSTRSQNQQQQQQPSSLYHHQNRSHHTSILEQQWQQLQSARSNSKYSSSSSDNEYGSHSDFTDGHLDPYSIIAGHPKPTPTKQKPAGIPWAYDLGMLSTLLHKAEEKKKLSVSLPTASTRPQSATIHRPKHSMSSSARRPASASQSQNRDASKQIAMLPLELTNPLSLFRAKGAALDSQRDRRDNETPREDDDSIPVDDEEYDEEENGNDNNDDDNDNDGFGVHGGEVNEDFDSFEMAMKKSVNNNNNNNRSSNRRDDLANNLSSSTATTISTVIIAPLSSRVRNKLCRGSKQYEPAKKVQPKDNASESSLSQRSQESKSSSRSKKKMQDKQTETEADAEAARPQQQQQLQPDSSPQKVATIDASTQILEQSTDIDTSANTTTNITTNTTSISLSSRPDIQPLPLHKLKTEKRGNVPKPTLPPPVAQPVEESASSLAKHRSKLTKESPAEPPYGPGWKHPLSPRSLFSQVFIMSAERKRLKLPSCDDPWTLCPFNMKPLPAPEWKELSITQKEEQLMAKASWSALLTGTGHLNVLVEHCINCAEHNSTVSHNEQKYLHTYQQLKDAVDDLSEHYPVTLYRKAGIPRLGSFEVSILFDINPSAKMLKRLNQVMGARAKGNTGTIVMTSKLRDRAFPPVPLLAKCIQQILELRKSTATT